MASVGTFSGGGLGMGVAFKLDDQFSSAARDIQKSMSELEGVTENAMKNIDKAMTQVKVGAVAMGAGLALAAPFAFGVKLAANAEQLEIAYGTILKSDTKAKELLSEMNKFADLTPYDPAQVQDAGKSLLAMGTDAKNVIPVLTQLGDIASGLNIPLKDLADIYGKNLVQGFLDTQDVKQMAGRGIPIFKALKEAFAKQGKIVTEAEILDLAPKRAITADIFKDAIASMTGEGGQFTGLMARQSQSAAGLWSTAQGYIDNVGRALGRSVLPQIKAATGGLIEFLGAAAKFVDTELGQSFIKVALGISIFLIAMGAVLVSMGLWNVAKGYMLRGLVQLGLTEVATAFTTGGLAAGFSALATAVWAALAPMLPFIAAGAVLVGIYMAMTASIDRFNDVMSGSAAPAKGILGFMQRLGGVLSAVSEIWTSWNSDLGTFSMPEGMENALQKLGILDFVLSLSTWIVRIKAFFDGIAAGAKEAWEVVTWAWGAMKTMVTDTVNGLSDSLTALGFDIGKLGGEFETYYGIGKIVGWGLIILFGALAAIILVAGAVAVIALLAIFVAIGIVLAAAWLIYKAFEAVFYVLEGLGAMGAYAFNVIYEALVNLYDSILELPQRAWDAGVSFVQNLRDGIASAWGDFLAWIAGKMSTIPLVGQFFSSGEAATDNGAVGNESASVDRQGQTASLAGARAAANAPAVFDKSSRTTENITLYTTLDTEVIAEKVMDKTKLASARE